MSSEIRALSTPGEARRCAEMMCSTDPWITIGRTYEECLASIRDPTREIHLAYEGNDLRGFIMINMRGPFIGYIQAICVDAAARGSGIGTKLIEFAEKRIFAQTPNVFLCVSSFNLRARALYERLGYTLVGELKDFIIPGASEFLMRKTIGPLRARAPRRT